jgi:hypothetical protein
VKMSSVSPTASAGHTSGASPRDTQSVNNTPRTREQGTGAASDLGGWRSFPSEGEPQSPRQEATVVPTDIASFMEWFCADERRYGIQFYLCFL